MHIYLNGTATEVVDKCKLDVLLKQLDLQGKRLALEVNKEIVPRSHFDKYELTEGDKVEIVEAIGGG